MKKKKKMTHSYTRYIVQKNPDLNNITHCIDTQYQVPTYTRTHDTEPRVTLTTAHGTD